MSMHRRDQGGSSGTRGWLNPNRGRDLFEPFDLPCHVLAAPIMAKHGGPTDFQDHYMVERPKHDAPSLPRYGLTPLQCVSNADAM